MNILQAISPIISFCHRYCHGRKFWRIAACAVVASGFSAPLLAANTIVRMEMTSGDGITSLGNIDIELYDDQAPKTVANFLRYAGRGYYNGVIIHRSSRIPTSGVLVIQGGGYKCCDNQSKFITLQPDPPIQNEFDLLRSNDRGTIAMAKLSGLPDSASNQWFFNVADNSAVLDDINNSGGFTVFGHVLDTGLGTGMDTVDAISALNRLNWNPLINELPVRSSYDPLYGLQLADLVIVNRIPNVAGAQISPETWAIFTTEPDMTFNAASTVPPDLAVPLLATFSSPPAQYVNFNNGMFRLLVSGSSMGSGSHVVTLYDGATTRPTHYYAYGKTPDNPADHWYDFSYDSTTGTGAEILSDRILLHFVDGKRGDDDLATANNIVHVGAQVVLGPPPPTQTTSASGGGCSIATNKSSQTLRVGDWLLVSLFLIILALMRRHTCSDRNRNTIGD